MTLRLARSLAKPMPLADDIHNETVGTSAEEVDLYAIFGVDPSTLGSNLGPTFLVTIEADGECDFHALSATGGTAVTSGGGKRLLADTPYVYEVRPTRRYISIIADAADTNVEFVRG